MHQQEVAGILLLADLLGHAGRHRHGGHACGANQRVDLAAGEDVHQLGQQHAACGAKAEGDDAEDDDVDGLHGQEGGALGGRADRQAQEDGHDVAQLVLGGLVDALHDAADAHQVAQHQHAHQGGRVGQQQRHDDRHRDGEDDRLGLGDLAQLAHADGALLVGGQRLHDGRLDDRHQGHVAVGRHGDGAQQVGRQLGGDEDGRRAVSAADDADGAGLAGGEAQQLRAQEGQEDAQLGRSAQQQALRVGDQRGKVGHRAHAHEDQGRVDAQLDALVQVVQQAAVGGLHGVAHLTGGRVHAHHHVGDVLAQGLGRSQRLRLAGVEGEGRMAHHARSGQVGQQHAEGYGQQQQRLELLHDRQVQQEAGHGDHHVVAPVAAGAVQALGKAGGFRDIAKALDEVDVGVGAIRRGRGSLHGGGFLGRHGGFGLRGVFSHRRKHGQQGEQHQQARKGALGAYLFQFGHSSNPPYRFQKTDVISSAKAVRRRC